MAVVSDTLEDVALALVDGRACIFPTDTVYGVGIAVHAAAGPAILFDVKRRDAVSLSLGLSGRLMTCNGMARIYLQLPAHLLGGFGRAPLLLSLRLQMRYRHLMHRSRGQLGYACLQTRRRLP